MRNSSQLRTGTPDLSRITPTGRYLRRLRLDELPQLWNIFVGDMSFVGPRPLLAADQPADPSARLVVRPGLTGWAQVTARRDADPEIKAALDAWYLANASIYLDLKILLHTVVVVIWGERIRTAEIADARAFLSGRAQIGPERGRHSLAVNAG